MSRYLLLVISGAAGMGLAVQAVINARLGRAVTPPLSALWNFVLGTVALGLLLASGWLGRGRWSGFAHAPWWAWLGGLLGAFYVVTVIVVIPRAGAAGTLGTVICMQLIAALVVDTFGWLGVARIPLNGWRIAGAGLLIVGVILIQQK